MWNITEHKNFIPQVLRKHHVPGACITIIKNGKIILSSPFGFRNAITKVKLEVDTIFEAASLTKPVVAYAALQLCEQGVLEIDKPLHQYLDKSYLENQPLYKLITLRHVLSHSCGFPNHAQKDELKVLFNPGEKFTYSGEGFMYLQHVIEHITDIAFDKYIEEKIFKPFKMNNSSLVWKECFDKQVSYFHDKAGNSPQIIKDYKPLAKGSLLTTASDYARFLIKLFDENDNSKYFINKLFKPEININEYISWSLGWGVVKSDSKISYWHWGDNNCFKSFTLFNLKDKSGAVILTNGYNGLSVCKEIIYHMYGEHFAFSKLLDEWYKEDKL